MAHQLCLMKSSGEEAKNASAMNWKIFLSIKSDQLFVLSSKPCIGNKKREIQHKR
ncbi:hypothetical protein HMPREF1249_0425 [Jonquetella sp. BV3C21]|nr:hypothetical protein HMPREF1249_0425 [Jonquetella sp. BV3C21]